jgi:hypothetical protein
MVLTYFSTLTLFNVFRPPDRFTGDLVFYFRIVMKDAKATTPFTMPVSKRSESSEYRAGNYEKFLSLTSDRQIAHFYKTDQISIIWQKLPGLCSNVIKHATTHRVASCCINTPSRLFNCRSDKCLLETLTLTPRPDLIPYRLLLVLLDELLSGYNMKSAGARKYMSWG